MTTLRNLFTWAGGNRFDRYYGDVIRAGVGYPTADEARRDLVRHDQVMLRHGWMR